MRFSINSVDTVAAADTEHSEMCGSLSKTTLTKKQANVRRRQRRDRSANIFHGAYSC
jgi:hypothetical protein